MSAPTHYQEAERLLGMAEDRTETGMVTLDPDELGVAAMAHGTLALVGAVDRLTRFAREVHQRDQDESKTSRRLSHDRITTALELAAAGTELDQLRSLVLYGDPDDELSRAVRERKAGQELIDQARTLATRTMTVTAETPIGGVEDIRALLDRLADALEDRL